MKVIGQQFYIQQLCLKILGTRLKFSSASECPVRGGPDRRLRTAFEGSMTRILRPLAEA